MGSMTLDVATQLTEAQGMELVIVSTFYYFTYGWGFPQDFDIVLMQILFKLLENDSSFL